MRFHIAMLYSLYLLCRLALSRVTSNEATINKITALDEQLSSVREVCGQHNATIGATSESDNVMKSVNSRLTCTYVEIRQLDACMYVRLCIGRCVRCRFRSYWRGMVRHVSQYGGTAEGGSLIQYGRIVRILS